MANYEARARSNYFAVRDLEAFKTWCAALNIDVASQAENPGLVTMRFDTGVPSDRYNEDTDEHQDFEFFTELAPHIAEGHVAIIIEIGRENMRYLVGYAVAVNAAGEIREITLESIYELAQELAPTGADIIRAEY